MAAERKQRPLRLPSTLDKALERAAARELRSVNFIIERILRDAMTKSGDLRDPAEQSDDE